MSRMIVALSALLFAGLCACSPIKRGMLDDHTYYSTQSPCLKIAIGQTYACKTDSGAASTKEFIDAEDHRYINVRFYREHQHDTRIDYYNDPMHWIFYDVPNCIEFAKGETEILGLKWYYRDFFHQHSSASCSLVRDLGHFTDRHETLKVLYVQELPPYQCASWKASQGKEAEQQERFARFLEDWGQDIRILNYNPEP